MAILLNDTDESFCSHIRLQKNTLLGTFKLTIPAHRPIKRSTLAHIIKEAKLTVDQFNDEGSVPILVLNGADQNMTCQLLMIL